MRWNKNTDTPVPPDEPAGQNPPDGAILNYWLPADARDVTLEIVDAGGSVVRKHASSDALFDPGAERVNFPRYWIRPPQRLSAASGFHRFVWDVRYPPPRTSQFSYPIAAIHRNTPRQPEGPWAPPGSYTVRLTVDGAAQTRPLLVKMDPRVKTSTVDLARQFTLSKQLCDAINALDEGQAQRRGQLLQLYGIIQGADVGPTSQVEAAVKSLLAAK